MAWAILAVAVVCEIIWALSLKWAAGQGTLAASAVATVLAGGTPPNVVTA